MKKQFYNKQGNRITGNYLIRKDGNLETNPNGISSIELYNTCEVFTLVPNKDIESLIPLHKKRGALIFNEQDGTCTYTAVDYTNEELSEYKQNLYNQLDDIFVTKKEELNKYTDLQMIKKLPILKSFYDLEVWYNKELNTISNLATSVEIISYHIDESDESIYPLTIKNEDYE